MDPVEQVAYESLQSNVYIESASRCWQRIFSAEPAYVEVMSVEAGISNDKVVVECDGLRIWAWRRFLRSTATWRIAENGSKPKRKARPFATDQYCELDAVSIIPYLDLRRERLQQRGLYQSVDVIDVRQHQQKQLLP